MGDQQSSVAERVAQIASAAADKETAAREIAGVIRAGFGYRWTGIYEVGAEEIYALAWDGPHDPEYPRFPKSKGLCGQAVSSKAAVRVDDVTKDPDYLTTFSSTRSELVVPVLTTSMEVVGLIDVESERVAAFSDEDRSALQECAAAIRPLWGG